MKFSIRGPDRLHRLRLAMRVAPAPWLAQEIHPAIGAPSRPDPSFCAEGAAHAESPSR